MTPHSAFGEETEYFMLVVDPNAPLYQLRLDLPPHHLSAVPALFFTGRFEIVKEDKQLAAPDVWRDYLQLDTEFDISDILDPNQEERNFWPTELEGRNKSTVKQEARVDRDGNKILKIRRGRRIKTRK